MENLQAVSREHVRNVVKIYAEAWTTRDPDLITSLFTDDATYHEYLLTQGPHRGKDGIRRYWIERVVGGQDNIVFELLNLYVDGNVAIAEWQAEFDVAVKRGSHRKLMREVAILEFRGDKIKSLREYWQSKDLGAVKKRRQGENRWGA